MLSFLLLCLSVVFTLFGVISCLYLRAIYLQFLA